MKYIRSSVYMLVLILVVIMVFTFYGVIKENIGEQYSTYEASSNTKSKILRIVDEVKSLVEKIRNLRFPYKMQIRIINTTWVLEHWGPPPKPSKEMLIKEIVYKLSLLVPPNFSIISGERQWTASFMAAAAGYTLYIVEDNFDLEKPVARRALAHELVHILQYHYFHVAYPSTLDGRLAVLALIEGDADLVADTFCNLTGIPPRPRLGLPLNNPYIALHSFPYIFGEDFVLFLYSKGGWDLVNKAYTNPPRSTEQIMNPEKYLENEEPVKVELQVNESTDPLYTDVMGEYYILLVLATKIDFKEAYKAAQGWGGDMLALFHDNNTNTWTLYWNITWDTTNDAQEFYKTFNEALVSLNASKINESMLMKKYQIWDYTIEIKLYGQNTFIIVEWREAGTKY